ncbi:acyl-CoA dehydrogenase [Zhongshania sp.]|jgi:alkylation response protein AidB-like acyl-CoA dehydrogenase|uniref:acyl-CoA dehydrogenase family protein n=1 Tax=Zhongshania sp. TaxID=1971902 RepID=UPI002A7F59A0|nr:acyl-CoA dehydrogenase [Zhongshania sp.]
MNFSMTEEQLMLKDSVAKYLQDTYSAEHRVNILKQTRGYSAENWQTFADLGWLTVPFAEEDGGFGGNISDVSIIMEEFGSALVIEPFWSGVVLAGQLIARSNNDSLKKHLMPTLMSGEQLVSFAFLEPQSVFMLNHLTTTATKVGDNYLLSGEKRVVLNATADSILIPARTAGDVSSEQGISLFLVDANDPGLQRDVYRLMDGQLAMDIRFDGIQVSSASMLTAEGEAFPLISEVVSEALVALCAEAVGAMNHLYKATADYCRTREQFGVAIGTFQALQHRIVDMFMATEQCRSLLMRAQCSILDGSSDIQRDVAALKVMIGKHGRHVAEEAVQLHGGMGMSNEMPIGIYLKRLMMIDSYLGNKDHHRRQFCKLRYCA